MIWSEGTDMEVVVGFDGLSGEKFFELGGVFEE